MLLLTEDADLRCDHMGGKVVNRPSQNFVCIAGRRVLIEPDPIGCGIGGCPNAGPTIKPCTSTLTLSDGTSPFMRISGRAICLDSVTGKTDGTPPGTVNYQVLGAGQSLVRHP